MVRSQTPMISAASSQLIFFAIAFKITSCSFIIRSTAVALTDPGFIKPQHRCHFVKRTDHYLIRPDKSHTNDMHLEDHASGRPLKSVPSYVKERSAARGERHGENALRA